MRAQLDRTEQMLRDLSNQMQVLQLQQQASAAVGGGGGGAGGAAGAGGGAVGGGMRMVPIGMVAPGGGFVPFGPPNGAGGYPLPLPEPGKGVGGGDPATGMHFMGGASAPPQTQAGFAVPAQPFAPQGAERAVAMPPHGEGAGAAAYGGAAQIPHGPIASPGFEFRGGGAAAASYPPVAVGGAAFQHAGAGNAEAGSAGAAADGGGALPGGPDELMAYLARIRAERAE